jgi:hypothetical protein
VNSSFPFNIRFYFKLEYFSNLSILLIIKLFRCIHRFWYRYGVWCRCR